MGDVFVCDRCLAEFDLKQRKAVDVRWTYRLGDVRWNHIGADLDICDDHLVQDE
jgi:hypothetical protein